MDTNNRLRLATRIHYALLRCLGEGIDVSKMLADESEAREVLWVCEGSGDLELRSLARQYRRAGTPGDDKAAASGQAPREAAWARNTSGFGLTQPPPLPAPTHTTGAVPQAPQRRAKPAAAVPSGWRKTVGWLRGEGHFGSR